MRMERLHNEELHSLYRLRIIVRVDNQEYLEGEDISRKGEGGK
jgi:hypothetical protein